MFQLILGAIGGFTSARLASQFNKQILQERISLRKRLITENKSLLNKTPQDSMDEQDQYDAAYSITLHSQQIEDFEKKLSIIEKYPWLFGE